MHDLNPVSWLEHMRAMPGAGHDLLVDLHRAAFSWWENSFYQLANGNAIIDGFLPSIQ